MKNLIKTKVAKMQGSRYSNLLLLNLCCRRCTTNIVLTRNKNYKCKGAVICHSVEAVLEEIKKYRSEDVYIIGGESVYQAFMPYADRIHLTRIDYVYEIGRASCRERV